MRKTEKGVLLVFFMLLLVFASVNLVFGFGVSYSGRPTYIMPGESQDINFRLQNMVGDEDYTVTAEIVEHAEIAKIVDEDNKYEVPAGVEGVKVNLRISVPETDEIGKEYTVKVSFTAVPVSVEGGTPVAIGSGIVKNALVIVGEESMFKTPTAPPKEEKPEKTTFSLVWIIVLIVLAVLVFVIWFSLKKKNKTASK